MTKYLVMSAVVAAVISVIIAGLFGGRAVVGAGMELVVTNFVKGVRYNGLLTAQVGQIAIPAGTSTEVWKNTTGKVVYVDPRSVIMELYDPKNNMATTATSTMLGYLATSSVSSIGDYTLPPIVNMLVGSSTMATTGPARAWTPTPIGLVASGGTNPITGLNQTGGTSNHASGTVAIQPDGYLMLIQRGYLAACQGSAGHTGDNNLVERSCESGTSSPSKLRATFQYWTR